MTHEILSATGGSGDIIQPGDYVAVLLPSGTQTPVVGKVERLFATIDGEVAAVILDGTRVVGDIPVKRLVCTSL